MKKFDNAIKDVQQIFLKEVYDHDDSTIDDSKVHIEGQGTGWDAVDFLNNEITKYNDNNEHSITMHAVVSWDLNFENFKSDGEGGYAIGPGDTTEMYPYVFVGAMAETDRRDIIDPNRGAVLIATDKDPAKIVHAIKNDLEYSEEYNEFWVHDPTLKQNLFEYLQEMLRIFTDSKEAKECTAFTTYQMYSLPVTTSKRNNKTQIEKFIEIVVEAPSRLDKAKDATKEDTDDISNW